ncbi:TPA: 30S ribosomal protein S17 [Candidatus Collierbacteria bacterium]|uniref:30S ribosomal protein S17 n=1 Tax=Candidatus Collierbacteria bacterium GW2011_GWA2_42_17 TaxID=1618378 RepID=A0A0G1BAI1_9BACT|nr:MAG: 30S ribosomal protein S17 [Candidatus Collierbacteria bacterium GW2011_GWB2_42_12]KKS43346.1 MAG: 30S ribosomal protein S17 [Candidatus Collierbacteria bacterium GW2011_GWA2_42_17]KKS61940.1 MAG: 30S ribosomal protein S17 [Candidatus Collierbacteria bacterium GW2011_GWE2_42_48]KKS63141.1 MAG: 30S ribosomal protein S17 [Candidatus Collierbacteria bacterium GW2011_GWD2_42_50]KKS63497.1 MAG: 30S ribosomal protein S17 [Candidatus Collierbacteria bacterium GW2011_GWF1_42_50]KKS64961.1 MAG: 
MKKHLTGTVKSAKMIKTAVVDVVHFQVHPKYLKRIKVNKSYTAHNEIGAKEGDSVRLEETRPISKNKHWQITKVL